MSCSAAAWSCTPHPPTATSSRRPSWAPASPTTPSATCAGRKACFAPARDDREFADHNKALMQGWLSAWVPRALRAARTMQPLWSQPDHRPPRFEDSLDRVKNRFAGILSDLGLDDPEGAGPVTTTAAEAAFGAVNATSSGMCGITLMNDQVGEVIADVMKDKPGVTVTYLPSMIRLDAVRADGLHLRRARRRPSARSRATSARTCSRRACRPTTAGWSTRTTGRSCSPTLRTRPSTSASTSCVGHRRRADARKAAD